MKSPALRSRTGQGVARKSVRGKFERDFGKPEAERVFAAAVGHKNGVHDGEGSDPFKWAILICLGHECFTRFREHHGFKAPWPKVQAWIKRHGKLDSHDGDCDYLAMMCGVYNEYMPADDTSRKASSPADKKAR